MEEDNFLKKYPEFAEAIVSGEALQEVYGKAVSPMNKYVNMLWLEQILDKQFSKKSSYKNNPLECPNIDTFPEGIDKTCDICETNHTATLKFIKKYCVEKKVVREAIHPFAVCLKNNIVPSMGDIIELKKVLMNAGLSHEDLGL